MTDVRVSGTLVNMENSQLDQTIIEAALAGESIGHSVEYYCSVASTMPLARNLAIDPATRPGTIVIAEEQTAGRGRLSRGWEAPFGDALLLTVVVTPPLLPLETAQLPMIAGIGILEAIRQIAPATEDSLALKWPNDVLLSSIGKNSLAIDSEFDKVAGILIEAAYTGPTMDYALLGMGINANQQPQALPQIPGTTVTATSIRAQTGRSVDRTSLCVALCSRLSAWLASAQTPVGSDQIHQRWRSLLTTLGQDVTVRRFSSNEVLLGRAVDVDRSGNLIVQDEFGEQHICSAGDVTLRPACLEETQLTSMNAQRP